MKHDASSFDMIDGIAVFRRYVDAVNFRQHIGAGWRVIEQKCGYALQHQTGEYFPTTRT